MQTALAKKAYDFIIESNSFNESDSVIKLGVGKNMVASIKYWSRAFGLIDEKGLSTEIADYIFGKTGRDIYLEDIGTLWLLHYHLIKTDKASIYNLVFNEFKKERSYFTKEQLLAFIKRKYDENGIINLYNENTINLDINIFLKNYLRPSSDDQVDIEEDFSGLLLELDVLKNFKQKDVDNRLVNWYQFEHNERDNIPCEIIFYSILDNFENSTTISFNDLLIGNNSPGLIFSINSDGLYKKLIEITNSYNNVTYSETAGNQILQISKKFNPYMVLNGYYKKNSQ